MNTNKAFASIIAIIVAIVIIAGGIGGYAYFKNKNKLVAPDTNNINIATLTEQNIAATSTTESMDYFINAAKQCSPATLDWKAIVNTSDAIISYQGYIQAHLKISGYNNSGKLCLFSAYIDNRNLNVSPSAEEQAKRFGRDSAYIQQRLQEVLSIEKKSIGMTISCDWEKESIVSLLEYWSYGNYDGLIGDGFWSCTAIDSNGKQIQLSPSGMGGQ